MGTANQNVPDRQGEAVVENLAARAAGPFGNESTADAMATVGRADRGGRWLDCGTFPGEPGCTAAGHDARGEHVHCRGDHEPHQPDCAVPARPEPGEFPGPDA